MLMEALFSRGGMPIHHRINGFNYVFTRNDDGDFVCPVLSGEHRQMMIQGGNFRRYEPKVREPEAKDAPLITTRPADAPVQAASKQLVVEDRFDAVSAEVAQAQEDFSDTIAAMGATPDEPTKPRRGGRRKQK